MTRRLFIHASAFVLSGLLLLVGCSKKEVPFVIDDEEIRRYLAESEDARELFRIDNLFGTDEYTVEGDSAVYEIIVDSVKRRIDLDTHVDTVRTLDFGDSPEYYRTRHLYPAPLGEMFGDCEATVDDIFYIRNLRIVGADTTVSRSARAVNRYGFLLKMGGDLNPFRGWKLWGYNGSTSPGAMVITTDDLVEFRGDAADLEQFRFIEIRESLTYGFVDSSAQGTRHAYRRLDQVAALTPGALLYLNCYSLPSDTYYRLVTGETESGMRTQTMDRISSQQFVDTLQIPSDNPRLWNLLFMQDYRRVLIPGSNPPSYTIEWAGWCVPYRVPQ